MDMLKKSRLLVVILVLMQIFLTSPSYAEGNNKLVDNQVLSGSISVKAPENIKLVDNKTSASELILIQNDKKMLAKQWYTYKFEVDTERTNNQPAVYPVDRMEYQNALDRVAFPLEKIGEYKVYFLDYKLKNYSAALALSFLDDSVVVFGSYYQLSQEKIHRLAVHELGHQIDFQLMNPESWRKYREIRGLTDETVYNNRSLSSEKRPQEIFAEDFRLLFGGEEALKVPHLNQELKNPNLVPGLKELYLSIIPETTMVN
jgi:hypothetical protein